MYVLYIYALCVYVAARAQVLDYFAHIKNSVQENHVRRMLYLEC